VGGGVGLVRKRRKGGLIEYGKTELGMTAEASGHKGAQQKMTVWKRKK